MCLAAQPVNMSWKEIIYNASKNLKHRPGVVAYACNPSNLGGQKQTKNLKHPLSSEKVVMLEKWEVFCPRKHIFNKSVKDCPME